MNEMKPSLITWEATVNGVSYRLDCDPEGSLLDLLRERLGLTGAKKCCDTGACGSCTVILNGMPALACMRKVKHSLQGRIETIEGLSNDGKLHPLQEAFIQHHGFQCGICTPGLIMAAKSLLDTNPNPSREDILKALKRNICRCTGYEQVVEAVAGAIAFGRDSGFGIRDSALKILSPGRTESRTPNSESRIIGRSHPRHDAAPFTTGAAKYTCDYFLPDMLHGATVRSPHPHAKILGIEASEALSAPGVVTVLTAKDLPGANRYGKGVKDQYVLAEDTVRFVGEAVALVIAETREQAYAAVPLVKVSYQTIPAVFQPEEALAPSAPQVHEEGNLLSHYHLEKGDIEAGFAGADFIHEARYTTTPQDHMPLEPEGAVAWWNGTVLELVSPGQHVFFDKLVVMKTLRLGKDEVHAAQPAIGASYGRREDLFAQVHAALGAYVTRRPVKFEWSREECLLAGTKRTRQFTTIKLGADKNGHLTAFEARIVGDAGAYASWSVNIMRKAGVLASGPYEIPNVKVNAYAAYTNCPPSGPIRGFGAVETAFCTESAMDELAEKLGLDPVEFRLKNLLKTGSRTATNQVLEGPVPVKETLEAALGLGARGSGFGSRTSRKTTGSVLESSQTRYDSGEFDHGEELSEVGGLENSNGFGRGSPPSGNEFSPRRTFRADEPNEKSGHLHPLEHRGGIRAESSKGVCLPLVDLPRVSDGIGNPDCDCGSSAIPGTGEGKTSLESVPAGRANVDQIDSILGDTKKDSKVVEEGWVQPIQTPTVSRAPILRASGYATTWYGIGFGAGIPDEPGCYLELDERGMVTLYVGTVEYGNGSNTTFPLLAAEMLGMTPDRFRVVSADTDLTPNCGSTVASKQTYTTGNAVIRAAALLKEKIAQAAARELGVTLDQLEFNENAVFLSLSETRAPRPETRIPLSSLASRLASPGKPLRVEATFPAHQFTERLDPQTGQGRAWHPYAYGTHRADVEVNMETGEVLVKKLVCAHYVGKVLNPPALRGQIVGGAVMGLGFALCEDADYVDGVPQATALHKYHLLKAHEIPEFEVIAIEDPEPTGPFGAIGIGEPPTIPPAAAVANAVYAATGVRIRDLPITKEKVLAGLKELQKNQS